MPDQSMPMNEYMNYNEFMIPNESESINSREMFLKINGFSKDFLEIESKKTIEFETLKQVVNDPVFLDSYSGCDIPKNIICFLPF